MDARSHYYPNITDMIYDFCDERTRVKLSSTCHFWKDHGDQFARGKIETIFPDEYQKIQENQLSHSKINWLSEYQQLLIKYTYHFNPQEWQDYCAIRSFNLAEIRKILARPNAEKDILLIDQLDKTIFDYLVFHPLPEKKQTIYNLLFTCFSKNLKKNDTEWDDTILFNSKTHANLKLNALSHIDNETTPVILILGIICNQAELVKKILQNFIFPPAEFNKISLHQRLCGLALSLSQFEIFFMLIEKHSNPLVVVNSIFITSPLENYDFQSNQTFCSRLFDYISQLNINHDPMLYWAVILKQKKYIDEAKDIEWQMLTTLEQNSKDKLFHTMASDIEIYQRAVSKNIINPNAFLKMLGKAGNILILQNFLSSHPNLDLQEVLGDATFAGHLDCVKFLFSKGAKLDDKTLNIGICLGHLHILIFFAKQENWNIIINTIGLAACHTLFRRQVNLPVLNFLKRHGLTIERNMRYGEERLKYLENENISSFTKYF